MYKATVRALVRRGLRELSAGNPEVILRLAARDAELAFPGDNSWAAMFRPVVKGTARHVTHRGIDECRAFAERFVAEGIRFGEPEDILVNGPPWRTRVAVRVHDAKADPGGGPDVYTNRAVAFLELRWGKVVRWEDYEDTERIAAWDAAMAAAPGPATPVAAPAP
jgi:ketosteroid isomerase-like protein